MTRYNYPEKSRNAEQKYQCSRAAQHDNHADTVVGHTHQDNAQHMARHAWSATKLDIYEMEQEVTQEYTDDDLEIVSINSVYFKKSCSMLMAKLKMSVDNNNMIIPYKIDTGSDRNIIPWYMFKNYSPG